MMAAVLLTTALAAGWDLFWRHRGFAPSVVDDVNIWSIWRRRADSDPMVVALAGSSRFLMGLNLQTLHDHFSDKKIVQLSVNGGSPFSVLNDLADDARFRGSVVCEILPHLTYTNTRWSELWGGYENLPWSQRFEAPLHVYLAKQTNLFLPDLTLTNVCRQFIKYRQLPRPGFIYFDKDRQGRMNFSQVSSADLISMKEHVSASYASAGVPLVGVAFENRVAEIRGLAEKIRSRGGQVLFIRMISSPPIREVENARFPDALYWNVFRRNVGFPCLNYADVPGLDHFICPEGVHLDQSEAPAFTAVLADAIAGRNLLR